MILAQEARTGGTLGEATTENTEITERGPRLPSVSSVLFVVKSEPDPGGLSGAGRTPAAATASQPVSGTRLLIGLQNTMVGQPSRLPPAVSPHWRHGNEPGALRQDIVLTSGDACPTLAPQLATGYCSGLPCTWQGSMLADVIQPAGPRAASLQCLTVSDSSANEVQPRLGGLHE